jgi:hypothetical protein
MLCAASTNPLRPTRRQRGGSRRRKNQTDTLPRGEAHVEVCRATCSTDRSDPCRPNDPAPPRRSRLATDHGRGTRALGYIRDRRYLQDTPRYSATMSSTSPRDLWCGVSGTRAGRRELPATLPGTRRCVAPVARDATASDFHLRHRRGAMSPWKSWRASGNEWLGAKRRHDHELEGVHVRWTDGHFALGFRRRCPPGRSGHLT